MHKRFATELRQPAGKQTLLFCIYTERGTAMLQSCSQQTNEILFFQIFLFFVVSLQRTIRIGLLRARL